MSAAQSLEVIARLRAPRTDIIVSNHVRLRDFVRDFCIFDGTSRSFAAQQGRLKFNRKALKDDPARPESRTMAKGKASKTKPNRTIRQSVKTRSTIKRRHHSQPKASGTCSLSDKTQKDTSAAATERYPSVGTTTSCSWVKVISLLRFHCLRRIPTCIAHGYLL